MLKNEEAVSINSALSVFTVAQAAADKTQQPFAVVREGSRYTAYPESCILAVIGDRPNKAIEVKGVVSPHTRRRRVK